jgi:hypothetical protein
MTDRKTNFKNSGLKSISAKSDRDISENNESVHSKNNRCFDEVDRKLELLAATFLEVIANINASRLTRQSSDEKDSKNQDSLETADNSKEEEREEATTTSSSPNTSN